MQWIPSSARFSFYCHCFNYHIYVRHHPKSLLSLCLKEWRYDLLEAPIKDSLVSSKLVCGQWNIRLYLSSCPLLCSVTRWARCYWRHLPGECQSASAASSGRWTNQRPGAGRDSQSEAGDWGNVRDEGGGERLTSGRWTHGDTSLVCQSHGWDTESRWTPGRTLCGDPSALGAATTGWSPG